MTTTELIELARKADLPEVARRLGLPLKREGKYWRVPGHGGLLLYPKNGSWVWCHMSEGRGGDAISFLKESPVSQMLFKEAVELLTGCPWPGKAGSGSKERKSYFTPLKPVPEPRTPGHDPALWGQKAWAFCQWCREQLMGPECVEVRQWLLRERGLHEDTIRRFGLGWNPRRFFRQKQDWGLDEDGKLALSSGLVIPRFGMEGGLFGVTIRRADPAEAEHFGRYHCLPSPLGRPVWAIRQEPDSEAISDGWPLVVMESELDAILLAQECNAIDIAVLGGAGRMPQTMDEDFWTLYQRASHVFVALDNDDAGQRATESWMDKMEKAVALPMPEGHKDPTEAYLAGVNLKQWLYEAFYKAGVTGWTLFSLGVETIAKNNERSEGYSNHAYH